MRKNNGITLIALIITIIIMLILVAVSISILINSGLIGKAKEAGSKTKTAYEEEQRMGDSLNIDGVMYNSIDEYIGDLNGSREIHNWQREGDTLTCNHCNATYEIGQVVNYTAGGIGTSSISAEMSGLAQAAIDWNDNTAAEDQTINKDTNTVWVVLGREDSNKDGNYETLLLTTQKPTDDEITLYGAAAYNNWVSECNRIAKDLYGNEARGMTIEDVNACLNYIPAGGIYYDGSTEQTTGNFTTKLKDLSIWNNIKANGTYTPDGTNTETALGNYDLNGYYYYLDGDSMYLVNDINPSSTSNQITSTERNLIFGTYDSNNGYSYYYWLVSRGVYAFSNYAFFGPGGVDSGDAYSYDALFDSNGYSNSYSFAFRAVVSLTSNIPE